MDDQPQKAESDDESSEYSGENTERESEHGLVISWPVDRPTTFELIPNHHHAMTQRLPFIYPRDSPGQSPTPAYSRSQHRGSSKPLPVPDGACPTCKSPYTRPLTPLQDDPLELGLIISPLAWGLLKSWAQEVEESNRREQEEQNSNTYARRQERYQSRRTAEVLRRRRIGRADEEILLQGAMDVERRNALNKLQVQANCIEHEVRNRQRQGPKPRNAVWTLWLLPKDANGEEAKGCSSIKLHVTQQLGLSEDILDDGMTVERECEVGPCLAWGNNKEWDKLRKRCLKGRRVDCVLVDAARTLSVEVQFRALQRTSLLEKVVKAGLICVKETAREKRVQVWMCVSPEKVDRESEAERYVSLRRQISLRRELSTKRRSLERMRRDCERQKALDKLEGRDVWEKSTGEKGGAREDSAVDLAALFENVMLGQRRNNVEGIAGSLYLTGKPETMETAVGDTPEEEINDSSSG